MYQRVTGLGTGKSYGTRDTGISFGVEPRLNNKVRHSVYITADAIEKYQDFAGQALYGMTYIPAGFFAEKMTLTIDETCAGWPQIEVLYFDHMAGSPVVINTIAPATINQTAPKTIDITADMPTSLEMLTSGQGQQLPVMFGIRFATGIPTEGKIDIMLEGLGKLDLGWGPVSMTDSQLYSIVVVGPSIVIIGDWNPGG